MEHPHIARVFDGGATDTGRPYFVMEYVAGDSITKFADAHSLTVNVRLELFQQVPSETRSTAPLRQMTRRNQGFGRTCLQSVEVKR